MLTEYGGALLTAIITQLLIFHPHRPTRAQVLHRNVLRRQKTWWAAGKREQTAAIGGACMHAPACPSAGGHVEHTPLWMSCCLGMNDRACIAHAVYEWSITYFVLPRWVPGRVRQVRRANRGVAENGGGRAAADLG